MPRYSRGFTLIEFVIVIILLGILSVTAASRLIGRSSFDAVVVRDQAIAMVRQIQLVGMNNPVDVTAPDPCLAFAIAPSVLGTPACSTHPSSVDALTTEHDRTTFAIQDNGVNLPMPLEIHFDMLGRPTMVNNHKQRRICAETRCEITITARNGEQSSLCINGEGYVNDCTL